MAVFVSLSREYLFYNNIDEAFMVLFYGYRDDYEFVTRKLRCFKFQQKLEN